MANAYKRLSALRPADTNEAELYAVPAATEAIVTVNICNQSDGAAIYSIALTLSSGAATADEWIIFEKLIDSKDAHQITGIAMAAGQTIRVGAGVGDAISFVAFGMEIT